ncbi:MAG: PAS domain-containing protein [Nitrospina sp.]|jgi:two-component system, NtrC family, sensor kinase|nr:PAS domain-containing protein [Nitrospina sp.]MBT5632499.1 PAS domain-containing protein [Nitrospina sp.]
MDTAQFLFFRRSSEDNETRKGIRTGLKNKLIWTMLGVGALPLMLAMILSYLQGTKSLQGVIGASFKVLAYETSTKIDLLIEGENSRNIRHAAHPIIRSTVQGFNQSLLALDSVTREQNIQEQTLGSSRSHLKEEASRILQSFLKRKTRSVLATQALYVTDMFGVLRASTNDFPEFLHTGKPDWEKTIAGGKDFVYIGPVTFNEKTQSFLMTFAFPVLDEKSKTIGVLHHVFDAKEFFSGSIEPITFGETGHVMLIDSSGMVIDCPILPTGFLLPDPVLVKSVTGNNPDWVKTMGNGHGGEELSLIGFSPLEKSSEWITRSEGRPWYTFAWQASDELFAPMHKLFLWFSMAGAVSILLIGGMGSLAAKKIVQPIRRLQKAAERIGRGEKVDALEIKTGDELEALANEVNQMNDLLQKSFSGLESQVRKKTEEVLYLKEYTDSILKSVPDAVVIFDPDLKIEYVNAEFEHVARQTAEKLLGHSLLDLELESASTWHKVQDALLNFYSEVVPIGSRNLGNQTIQCYTARDPLAPKDSPSLQSMKQTVKLDGKIFAFQIFDIVIHDQSGKRLGLLLRDVTEDVDLHDQLAMAEKLSGLGTLTAGIAHELNNPLVSIMGFTEAILDEKDPGKIHKYAEKVFDRSKHMASIILNMSGYMRSAMSTEEKEINLNEKIDAAIEIAILTSYNNDIKLDKNFSEVPPIKAKSEEIQQIFINLLTNAVQAMEGKGELRISTIGENGNVRAIIRDTGPGIPKEYLSKIYDPFFTTKEQGRGTGLGLNIVHQLVVKYGGKIDVSSQEGEGTTFSLTFPASQI